MRRIKFDEFESVTEEGRLMFIMLAHIAGTTHSDRTPEQTIDDLYDRYYDVMFGNEAPTQ